MLLFISCYRFIVRIFPSWVEIALYNNSLMYAVGLRYGSQFITKYLGSTSDCHHRSTRIIDYSSAFHRNMTRILNAFHCCNSFNDVKNCARRNTCEFYTMPQCHAVSHLTISLTQAGKQFQPALGWRYVVNKR
jgi:hypothetical protein